MDSLCNLWYGSHHSHDFWQPWYAHAGSSIRSLSTAQSIADHSTLRSLSTAQSIAPYARSVLAVA
eukprot:185761-Rhodomonas_salina.1